MAVAYYVVCHSDDWPLFRGEQAWADVDSGQTIVFIYITANDANRSGDFWKWMEEGALAGCTLLTGAPPVLQTIQTYNGHGVTTYESGNTISHFLRIPINSFMLLYQHNTPATTIDGSTAYQSIGDLTDTVRSILEKHRLDAGGGNPWVNSHDPDTGINPLDNDAHYHVGDIVQLATGNDYSKAWFVGYNIANIPANLSAEASQQKKQLFMAMSDKTLEVSTAAGQPFNLYQDNPPAFDRWCLGSYARAVLPL